MRPKSTLAPIALLVLAACGDGTSPTAADDPAAALSPVELEDAPDIEPTEAEPTAPNLEDNDADYLVRLGLIRGHLLVGTKLYRDGAVAAAKTHMKHPGDELYAGLDRAFLVRDADGFADELEALATRVEAEAPVAEVDAAYATLQAAIADAERRLNGSLDAPLRRLIVARLLGHAADEYAIGVVDGEVVEPHEYQDAYGFTQIARDYAAGDDDGEAMRATRAAIEGLSPLWPTLGAARVDAGGAEQIAAVTATLTAAP